MQDAKTTYFGVGRARFDVCHQVFYSDKQIEVSPTNDCTVRCRL